MTIFRTLACSALLICSTAFAADDSVELSYRLLPNRSVISESRTDGVTTIKVLEDRGIVAKSAEKGRGFPISLHVISRHVHRNTTGLASADGSFPVELEFLSTSSHLKLPSGEERELPGRAVLSGVKVTAQVDAQGRIMPGSAQMTGGPTENRDAALGMMASVLEQASHIPTITVGRSESTPQTVRMQLPVAGLTTMDLTMNIANRLVEVVEGVAKISMIYTFDFGMPAGPVKIKSDGTGGGTMLYEMATQLARKTDTNTLMSFTAETPEGTLGIQVNSRQAQITRDAPRQ